jgi:hypothetical protein
VIASYLASMLGMEFPIAPGVRSFDEDCTAIVVAFSCLPVVVSLVNQKICQVKLKCSKIDKLRMRASPGDFIQHMQFCPTCHEPQYGLTGRDSIDDHAQSTKDLGSTYNGPSYAIPREESLLAQ